MLVLKWAEEYYVFSLSGVVAVTWIIELFKLEGTLKGHLVQLPCNEQGCLQLNQGAQCPSILTLDISMDGHPPPPWAACASASLSDYTKIQVMTPIYH